MRTSIHSGGTGNIRHSPRSGFNSVWRDLPGDRLCPRHSLDDRASLPGWARATPVKLDTSLGVPGPHALTVRNTAARLARRSRSLTSCPALRPHAHTTASRPPHPAPRFVTIGRNAPLHRGGMSRQLPHISEKQKQNIFRVRAGQEFASAGDLPAGRSIYPLRTIVIESCAAETCRDVPYATSHSWFDM